MSAFDTAVADSKKLTSKPSNEDLLKLYGSFRPIMAPFEQDRITEHISRSFQGRQR